MSKNTVLVSPDRHEMTIHGPNGEKATLRSARPEGFIRVDIEKAADFEFSSHNLEAGEHRNAWLKHWRGRKVLIVVNTGPPTWWLPRAEFSIRKRQAMIGWIRGLVGIQIR